MDVGFNDQGKGHARISVRGFVLIYIQMMQLLLFYFIVFYARRHSGKSQSS